MRRSIWWDFADHLPSRRGPDSYTSTCNQFELTAQEIVRLLMEPNAGVAYQCALRGSRRQEEEGQESDRAA